MRTVAAILLLTLLATALGCTSQACRPCGPGYLGNIFIPQDCAGVDFRDACREHDACYSTDCPRKQCDTQFRDNLLCACECSHHPALCRLRAWNWYLLTRLGGGPGYQQCQCERGCDCGCGCDFTTGEPMPGGNATDDEIEPATLE